MKYGFASKQHEQFPPMVVVSIVNVCNQKCIHCHWPAFAKRAEYKANMMAWDVWTKVIDQMSQHPWSVLNLGTDGEPLMHKRFIDMMRYAKEKKIYPINITTNGILLKGELAETILKEELIHTINVSLDAFKADTYKQIRGTEYAAVHENLLNLIDIRKRLGASNVKLQVNIIDQPEAAAEVADFKAYWTPKVDNVMIRTYYDATHVTGATGPDITGKEKFVQTERWPCTLFWRRITVTDDGGIQYCIDDWYHQSRMGHIDQDTIKEVWQSAKYNQLREYHLKGEQHKNPYCADCTEWQGMRWDFDYFVAMEKMLGKKLL